MKKALKISAYILGAAIVLCGAIFFLAWKSPRYYTVAQKKNHPAVPFKNYTTAHAHPYIIAQPHAVIFGAHHTRNEKDSQIALLEQHWRRLQPTVALVEGRLGFLLPGLMDPVKELGEGGKVKQLAEEEGIPVYNWDLSKEELAKELQGKFTREQIALAQILNPYFSQLRFGKPANPAQFLEPFYKRAAYVGLEKEFQRVEDIDRVWRTYFRDLDWRTVSDEQELPGYLGQMMAATNDLRNQQLIAAVKELTARGERVFLICGSSHAYCAAPSFQTALRK